MLNEKRKEELLALTKKLIAQQSNSGCESDVADQLKAYMEAMGFDEVLTDAYGNVIGKIKGSRPGPTLLFDGHIDTVPVANPAAWTHAPYACDIVGGRLYGRGTSDMKGAVAAYTAAAAFFAADTDRNFAGDIYVDGVVHEECFEGVAARSISQIVQPDYVVIGEASLCNVKVGQRGRAEIVVETFGIPAHSANPEAGVNAVYGMCQVIEAIQKLPCTQHPVLGKGILELTDIKSTPYPGASVVPSYCRATYDRRLLVGETRESVLAPLQTLLDGLMGNNPKWKAQLSYAAGQETCYTGVAIQGERFFPGWLYKENDSFVQDVVKELEAIGQTPEVTQYSFCTNGSHYAGEAGIKTIGLGPGAENLAHTDDEYIELEQLYKVCDSYQAVMKALLK